VLQNNKTKYPFMNKFKTIYKSKKLKHKIRKLETILQAELEFDRGQKLFNSALNANEDFNMDDCHDALDCVNRAAKLAFEKDTELESKCEAFTGKIFFRGLIRLVKAKLHLTNCVRLAATLTPKDVT